MIYKSRRSCWLLPILKEMRKKERGWVDRRVWLCVCEGYLVKWEQERCIRLLLPLARDKDCYLHCFGLHYHPRGE